MARTRLKASQLWSDPSLPKDAQVYHLYCITERDAVETGPCKVGIATHLEKRFSSLQGGNWRPLVLCWAIRVGDRLTALAAESHCLAMLRPSIYHKDGKVLLASEWVEATPVRALSIASMRINAELHPNSLLKVV